MMDKYKSSDDNKLLIIDELNVIYKNNGTFIKAVEDASLFLEKGKIIGLVGESGSGKTQLALSVLGLNQGVPGIVKGSIRYKNINVLEGLSKYCEITGTNGEIQINKQFKSWNKLHKKQIKGLLGNEISMIFQEPVSSLDPFFTVESQLIETIMSHSLAENKIAASEMTSEWLKKVGFKNIDFVRTAFPHQLSGGMCQRVMIALALCTQPELLIADEPTTAIDAPIQYEILSLLKKLNTELGVTIFFITHNLGIIKHFVDFVFVMYQGRIIDSGAVKQFFNNKINNLHPFTQQLIRSSTETYK